MQSPMASSFLQWLYPPIVVVNQQPIKAWWVQTLTCNPVKPPVQERNETLIISIVGSCAIKSNFPIFPFNVHNSIRQEGPTWNILILLCSLSGTGAYLPLYAGGSVTAIFVPSMNCRRASSAPFPYFCKQYKNLFLFSVFSWVAQFLLGVCCFLS